MDVIKLSMDVTQFLRLPIARSEFFAHSLILGGGGGMTLRVSTDQQISAGGALIGRRQRFLVVAAAAGAFNPHPERGGQFSADQISGAVAVSFLIDVAAAIIVFAARSIAAVSFIWVGGSAGPELGIRVAKARLSKSPTNPRDIFLFPAPTTTTKVARTDERSGPRHIRAPKGRSETGLDVITVTTRYGGHFGRVRQLRTIPNAAIFFS
uniref:Uncharacterized protein n=1 Tax=Globodera rostochiensis TaxID=31243 RepID=A0A914H3F2_GLORO